MTTCTTARVSRAAQGALKSLREIREDGLSDNDEERDRIDNYVIVIKRLCDRDTADLDFQRDLLDCVNQLPILIARILDSHRELKEQFDILRQEQERLQHEQEKLARKFDDRKMFWMEGQCADVFESLVLRRILKGISLNPGQIIIEEAIPFKRIVDSDAEYDFDVMCCGLTENQFEEARRAWAEFSRRIRWEPKIHFSTYYILKTQRASPGHLVVDLDKVVSCIPQLHPFPPDCDINERMSIETMRKNVESFISLIRRIREIH